MPQLAQMGVCNPGNPLQLVKITPNRRETHARRAVFTAAHAPKSHASMHRTWLARRSHITPHTYTTCRTAATPLHPRYPGRPATHACDPHAAEPEKPSRAPSRHTHAGSGHAHTRLAVAQAYSPKAPTQPHAHTRLGSGHTARCNVPQPRSTAHTYEKAVHPGPTQDARPSRTLIRRPAGDGTAPPAAGHGDRRQPRRASTQSTMYGATCSI